MEELRDGLPACFFLSASCPKSSPGSYLWQLLPITGSRWPNRACLVLCWCRVSLPWSKNLTQGHTEPNSFFCSKNEFTPPPKGGGAGYRLSWVCRVCLTRLQPAHTAPTGPVWSLAGVVLLLSFQNRTQGHVGLSLVSTLFLPYSFALAGLICPTSHARKNGLSPETNGKITEVF